MVPCIFNLGTGEVIIIVIVVLLLFGAKRIPELARSVGKGVSSFKQGLNEAMKDSSDDSKAADSAKDEETDKDSKK